MSSGLGVCLETVWDLYVVGGGGANVKFLKCLYRL